METETPRWGPVKRMLFRLAFVYFLLYLLPFPLNVIPYVSAIERPWEAGWNALVTWVGRLVFGVEITVLPNGSGDTTWNYVQVFCCLVLALAAAGVWTVLDRRRLNYEQLHAGLRVYVRFALAVAMITYGAVKVFKAQFAGPTLDRLLQPFGEASPMGLLWTFMAASESYNVFTGLGEMAGGLLLTARRTTLLGALVCIGVMSNVVMLNFSYDVPVKLYSSHLLAMAVFLVLPDLRRLVDFFVLDRPVKPAGARPLFQRRALHLGSLALRTVFIAGFAVMSLFGAWQATKTRGSRAPKAPFYGIWNVEELEVDGQVRPPLITDGERWRRVVFDRPGTLAVLSMTDSRERLLMDLDAVKKTMTLSKADDPAWKAILSYEQPGPVDLSLAGTVNGRKVRARLRRTDESRFLLLNRGFHWINEYPFSR
jgi:hypothetical protein